MTALANQHLVKNYCCAQCFGPLVERCNEAGQWVVFCPKNCKPGGYVTQSWAHAQQIRNHEEATEVKKNYPELSTEKPLTAHERVRMKNALYGGKE